MQELPTPHFIQVLWYEDGVLIEAIDATARVAPHKIETTTGRAVSEGEIYYELEGWITWLMTRDETLARSGDRVWAVAYDPDHCGWCGKRSDQLYWCDEMPNPNASGHYHEECLDPAIKWWEKNR